MKNIEIKNPTQNWRDYVPFGAELLFHVEASTTGYLHDVSVILTLSPIFAGEIATGWENIDSAILAAEQHMVDCWEMAQNDFAYSFKQII
ncbi:MAG: hypothetical protein PHD20_02880 [Clostridia bacterium]|nr:hypothetical protein [Clostridia bacterium]